MKTSSGQGEPWAGGRADAHRLVDQVPDDQVKTAVELLRQLAAPGEDRPRRRFRTVAVFDGDPDLGMRTKEIARRELGGRGGKSA